MTVSNTVRSATINGDGTTGPFQFNFRFLVNSDITIIKKDSGGNPTNLAETSDYILTGSGSYTGGTITLTLPLPVGYTLTVTRTLPLLQNIDLSNQGSAFPDTLEAGLDRLTMMMQQLGGGLTPVYQTFAVGENAGTYGTDLSSAVTSIGTSRLVTLLVNTPMTVNNNLIIPPNIKLLVQSPGVLNVALGKAVTGLSYIEPEWFGAKGDGVTDDSVAFAVAIAALGTNGTLALAATVYRGSISVRRGNVSIIGKGPAATTIRLPDSGTYPGGVIECGNTALGNSAPECDHITVWGITVDGNRGTRPDAADDLHEHGLSTTNVRYSNFSNIRAINCWNTGVGTFINSDYNNFSDIYVYNSGFTAYGGGYPGFDVNSSHYCTYSNIISDSCRYGIRLLDNCWGNIMSGTVKNATGIGFTYNNQTVNQSYNNQVTVNIEGGGSGTNGVSVGPNCRNSTINAIIHSPLGYAFQVANQSTDAYQPEGNTFNINTFNCPYTSTLVGGKNNTYNIISNKDGWNGAQGTYNAVSVDGPGNMISLKVIDSSPTWQVRSFVVNADAYDTEFIYFDRTDSGTSGAPTSGLFTDNGVRTRINPGTGYGIAIASAAAINIPFKGDTFLITGTTNITSIPGGLWPGRKITLIFAGVLTLTKGNNILINSNMVTTVRSSIFFVSDGVYWIELSRNVN